MANEKIKVRAFLVIEPTYSASGTLTGARIARVAQKAPKKSRSVELVLALPAAMFKPLRLAVEVQALEEGTEAEACVVVPVERKPT